MAARGSTTMQFVPSEVYQSPTPPSSPVVGQLWRNSAVTPNELLAWTGKGVSNARSYPGAKSGASVAFEDLSDDRALGVTVKAVAAQAGSGMPSPSNVRAISGKAAVKAVCTGKNILRPGSSVTSAGVAMAVAADGTVTLNGTCTASAGSPVLFTVPLGFFLTGQFTFSANNAAQYGTDLQMRLMESSSAQVSAAATNFAVSSVGAKTTFTLSNQYVYGYVICVAGGVTYNNAAVRPQLEPGAIASEYAPYAGAEYTLAPDAPLYGLTGHEDEIGTDGRVTHRTALAAFDGTWTASNIGVLTNVVRVQLTKSGVSSGTADNTPSICSHFPNAYDTGDTAHFYKTVNGFILYIPKSVLTAYEAAGVLAWLQARAAANAPVQVLYQLAAQADASIAPVRISGAAGMNVVASDGASAAVTYTGSGWAALGAVQRVAVESVSISPEEGLRVDTVLTSADGAHQVPTFFNARGARYGLFRSSDGMMILGGMVLPNGQPAGVAGALVSPGASGETRIGIETASEGAGLARVDTAALHLVQPSFAGAAGPDYAPTGEKTPVKIEAVRGSYLNAQSQCADNFNVSLTAINTLRLITTDESGNTLAWMAVQRTAEGSTISTDGAYAASDGARTLSNFAPMIQMSMPTGESIVYNATTRRYMPDWKTITDDYDRYGMFKGGNQSLRDVGVVIREAGHYRFVFHADLEQASSSSGAVLYINRMPEEWTPPTTCDYVTDADLTPTRLMYRRAASAPLNASVTTCGLVADMWCLAGDKILPVVSTAAASKALVSAGTFFTAQKIG